MIIKPPGSDDMFDDYDECNCNIYNDCDECPEVVYCKIRRDTDDYAIIVPTQDEVPYSTPTDMIDNFTKGLIDGTATAREGHYVPREMLLDRLKDGGFHFGRAYNSPNTHYVGKRQDNDGNILVLGPPGSHKTSAMIIPSLKTWQGHMVIVDVKPKGDLLPQLQLTGKHIKVFNPFDEDSCGIDPFSFIRSGDTNDLGRNARELALALIESLPESRDSVWRKTAQSLLTGTIVYHIGIGASFSQTMTAVALSSVKELIDEITKSDNKLAQMYVSKLKCLPRETLTGIGMDLTELAILAADSRIDSALCDKGKDKTINWVELNNSTVPFTIVLQLPEEYLDVWSPMTKLLINQLIRTLERRSDKYSADGKDLPPVLIVLDEFYSLGKIDSLMRGLSNLRNRGVTFCIVLQSLHQLSETYGATAREAFIDCCAYIAILKVNNALDQKYLSDKIGSIVTANKSITTIHNSVSGEMKTYNLQVSESREPIIYPHELATLKDVILLNPAGYCRIMKSPYYEE